MPEIILKPGRERSVLRHHPWIFSGAIARTNGDPSPGETVDVLSSRGDFLARGACNPHSNIACRLWTWDSEVNVDTQFLEQRFIQAVVARQKMNARLNSNARRLVHGESDGLPGLIVDQYNDACVVQFLSAGVEYWRDALIDIIIRNIEPAILYERSDVDVRELEGLPLSTGLLHGQLHNPVEITENGLLFNVDIESGHKTGFYLDQRHNRLELRQLASGLRVLDCFSYTGGFSVNALVGHAKSVTLVDSSAKALSDARVNIELNHFGMDRVSLVEQDVFKYLRSLRDASESYDLIILDPPKFAPTAAQVERATRAYKDINLLAFKLLSPGGYLLTFSCSGGVSEDLFQKVVAGAALDAGVDAVIEKRMHQSIDHPVALNFPEGAYLKGFIIQKRE